MDRGDHVERPPTTRIGSAGGTSRGISTVVVLVSLALVVAVVKPWDWIASPPRAPGREGVAIPVASPTLAPAPAPSAWTDVGARVACLSGGSWLAVVDQVDGPTVSRSWTRLDLAPAVGPADPAIARTHAYAEAVPRIGFCAPTGNADGAGGGASGDLPFRVRAWRLLPAVPAVPGVGSGKIREMTEIEPVVVSGGTAADHGVLYGPPAQRVSRRGIRPAKAAWPAGTYVFRVQIPGAGPSGSDVAWLAIELRGPWTGPEASVAPSPPGAPAVRDPSAAP